jgi:hypothetical protein
MKQEAQVLVPWVFHKYVRPGFLQAVLDAGSHWIDRPLLPNRLRADVNIW